MRGQSQTELRGSTIWLGTWHFWLGIALAVLLLALVAWRVRQVRSQRETHGTALLLGGVVAMLLVVAQGWLGGRMTYDQAVGIASGGQFAQTATGASALHVAEARGTSSVRAGQAAFAATGLGCARCHGDRAQGLRGPRLAGGAELEEFRKVHGAGLFPRTVVTDRDFATIDAYLRTLAR